MADSDPVDKIVKLKPQIQKIFIEAGILKNDSDEEWCRFCTWKVITEFLDEIRKMTEEGSDESGNTE